MNTELLTPLFSIIIRGSILAVLLLISIWTYLGALTGFGTDIITYLVLNTSIMPQQYIDIVKYSLLIILLIVFIVYGFQRERVYMGVLKFMSAYSISLFSIVLIVSVIVLVHDIVYGLTIMNPVIAIILSIVFITFTVLMITKYPLISLNISIISEEGGERRTDLNSTILRIGENDSLRIKIYGSADVNIVTEPKDSFEIMGPYKSLTYNYIDVKPASTLGGRIIVYYNDTLIYSVKIQIRKMSAKELLFNVFFNDDLIYRGKYKVEMSKDLLEASKPVIKAAIAKLNLTLDDIKEVQFYTSDNIHIPSETRIRDIRDIDEINIKLYSTEKYLELLRYYRKSDVFKLWDTLIKRLEIIRNNIYDLESLINNALSEAGIIRGNWW
jgi:hypothetical protein